MKNPKIIQPDTTKEGRLAQYVEEILKYDGGDTFTNRNLGLAGRIWVQSSHILRDAGMIGKIRAYTPLRYRLLVSKNELKAWLITRRGRI